jgi:D-glycero-D-manno-heptose 1,7-bisphosphate phosphatase
MRVVAALAEADARAGRLGPAVIGLAMRGHEVAWLGPLPPGRPALGTLQVVEHRRDLWGQRADLLVTGPTAPLRAALAGWLSGASCLVAALDHARVARWGWLDHMAWHSLHPLGLVEPAEGDLFRRQPAGLELDRLGLWSDASAATEPDPAHPDTEILERACERSLARHRGRADQPAAFLDRDGTLVREVGYLADPGDLELLPGVPAALRAFHAAGYSLVVVSNQSGVGRGFFGPDRVHEAMARLRVALRAEGVELDGIYFCPHRPDAGCSCRKPLPGLLERAAEDLRLALPQSLMIGDKVIDVRTGHAAGMAGFLVRTGYGRDEEQRLAPEGVVPEAVCDDVAAVAAHWLAGRSH